MVEALAIAAVLALALALLWGRRAQSGGLRVALAIGLVASAAAGVAGWRSSGRLPETQVENRPVRKDHSGYVSSTACAACHPREYGTWYVSYHRTMTQVATPESVAGPVDDVELSLYGRSYRIDSEDGEIWVETLDPATGREWRRRLVMSTGSHHFQSYWLETGPGRQVGLFEWSYQIAEARWIPNDAMGITPPGTHQATLEGRGRWNRNCTRCHSTAPKPRVSNPKRVDTHVAEFGIACESCHGPSGRHVRLNQSPWRRYARYLGGEPDDSVVHPGRLDNRLGSEVCGQCHAKTGFHRREDQQRWAREGPAYRPGLELLEKRRLVTSNRDPELPDTQRFWPDGMIRVNGREYNSLLENPCFEAGEMSCLSCHSMHTTPDDPRQLRDWADDQLLPGMRGSLVCTQCHADYTDEATLVAHTHHEPASTGSECMNCHMANTAYGLQKATRSHEIEHPSVATELATGRPNACNLCHLDRTLAWTGGYLGAWYGTEPVALDETQSTVAAGARWALAGDAGLRALSAWHMGWQPAREASGTAWMAPYLAQLLADPYDAVRSMSWRSLRSLEGFEDFEYDFLDPKAQRRRDSRRALKLWQQLSSSAASESSPPELRQAVLIDDRGRLRVDPFNALIRQRDNTPVFLAE